MISARISFMLLALWFFFMYSASNAQSGHSPLIDSLILQVTDSSLTLLDRQLSGDTTVLIGGVTDSIMTRHSNYADNGKAAQFILEKFQSYGLEAYIQQYDPNGQNVIATLPGTIFPDQQYIVSAHYDNMPNASLAPGADDNASGTSAVIEAARIMSTQSFPYTVRFIAFDEEEQGLIGSQYYADSAYLMGHQVLGVINLDMIAWDGNNDFACHVSTNTASLPLINSHIDNLKLYQPILTPRLITIGASDHFRFWGKGYPALLQIEEYQYDFHPYYHTVNDDFSNMNRPYFLAMARGAIASLLNMAKNYKMNLSHQPLANELSTGNRSLKLVVNGPNPVDTGDFGPRLYYKMDDGPFNFINPLSSSGDTLNFEIPEFPTGSSISYYFAVQDADGQYSVTLPEFGKGVNPPGQLPPPQCFTYYNLQDSTVNLCATGLPLTIPANSTVTKSINVGFGGRILDVNVGVSLSHTNTKDIYLYLVSPAGRQLNLSTRNGYILDHYINTVFDDEASSMINQALPPYTGSFRPEHALAIFRDTTTFGGWTLKIVNAGSTAGSLTSFCLDLTYSGDCRYVDASRPVSGDGRSWETALTSIEEASASNPIPGSVVLIKPGYYQDDLVISSSGQETVPLATGIILTDTNKVQFPEGTDLSGIDLDTYPGKYYAYIFRSRHCNNGFYRVAAVSDEEDFIRVEEVIFKDESGIAGDSSSLSAAIGLPVIYRKYTDDPDNEWVILDSLEGQSINSAMYIGIPVGDGEYDALPANYNIIDGIDLTGAEEGRGIHLQSSSFNVICNSRIFETNGTGIYINGNSDHPACYNIISGNEIFNTPSDGIRIGIGQMPAYNNQAHYNHLISNDIHLEDSLDYASMENAIHVNDYNHHTLIEKNRIHDISLGWEDNGALDIHSFANNTLATGNIFKNISRNNGGTNACIHIHGQSSGIELSNNLIFDSIAGEDDVYAIWIDGSGHQDSRLIHNSIFNKDRGFLLEDYGNASGFSIRNNIVAVNDQYFTHLGAAGNFILSNNLYGDDPEQTGGSPYSDEPGRQIGGVVFIDAPGGDFRLEISSEKAICNGMLLSPAPVFDINGVQRSSILPDIGACELEDKVIWIGSADQDWHNPVNWSGNAVPAGGLNVVIRESANYPLVMNGDAYAGSILLKSGSHLKLTGEHHLFTNN